MIETIDLDGPRFGRAPNKRAQELVILLHGLGADGNDLIALAPVFAQVLPEAAFVAPNAPFPCDMAPNGRQWFSFKSLEPQDILDGVRAVAPHVDAFIDQELERYGLRDDRLALVGFSQGTIMALHVGLRRAKTCAVLVGYSGALVAPELLEQEIKSRPPVVLVHGDADAVVPFQALAVAEAGLQAADVPVHTEARPNLGHGIDEDGVALGAAMLEQFLVTDAAEAAVESTSEA